MASSTLTTDPAVLTAGRARLQPGIHRQRAARADAARVDLTGGWYRRKFGNQTLTVDQSLQHRQRQLRRSVLPERAGRRQSPRRRRLPGLRPLRPEAVGRGAADRRRTTLLTFSKNYGGETNIYEGFDVSVNARPRPASFLQAGINAQQAHLRSVRLRRLRAFQPTSSTPPIRRVGAPGSRRDASPAAAAPAIRICRIVRTSSCSGRTRCRTTFS